MPLLLGKSILFDAVRPYHMKGPPTGAGWNSNRCLHAVAPLRKEPHRIAPGHQENALIYTYLATLVEDPLPSKVIEDPLDARTVQFLEEELQPFEELIGPTHIAEHSITLRHDNTIETALEPKNPAIKKTLKLLRF